LTSRRRTIFKTSVVDITVSGESNLKNLNKKTMSKFMKFLDGRPLSRFYEMSLSRFWESHVYQVFNRRANAGLPNSGQLGRALALRKEASSDGLLIRTMVKPLRHTAEPNLHGSQRSQKNRSGGATDNYAPYLIHGTAGSKFRYSPAIDRKNMKDRRRTAGVSPSMWQTWMSRFQPEFKKQTLEYIESEFREFVKNDR